MIFNVTFFLYWTGVYIWALADCHVNSTPRWKLCLQNDDHVDKVFGCSSTWPKKIYLPTHQPTYLPPLAIVTFETFNQSDEKTWPVLSESFLSKNTFFGSVSLESLFFKSAFFESVYFKSVFYKDVFKVNFWNQISQNHIFNLFLAEAYPIFRAFASLFVAELRLRIHMLVSYI